MNADALRTVLEHRRALLADAERRGLHAQAAAHRCRLAELAGRLHRLTAGTSRNGHQRPERKRS